MRLLCTRVLGQAIKDVISSKERAQQYQNGFKLLFVAVMEAFLQGHSTIITCMLRK